MLNFYGGAATYLVALALLAQLPEPKPLPPPQAQAQPLPTPENLKDWPRSCQRLHAENNKCENGLKSCNQHRVDYWRKKCERDEPHGQ